VWANKKLAHPYDFIDELKLKRKKNKK